MNLDNKYYSLITNAEHFPQKRSLTISSLNGEVTIQAVIENYCQDFDPVLDLIEHHFGFFFDRQYYNSPSLAVRDCIVYVGRQIHLTSKHNEVIFGVALSVVVTLLREQKLYVAKIGTLNLKQIQEDTTSEGLKVVDLFNFGNEDQVLLKMDNFHEVAPLTADINVRKDDRFVVAHNNCFDSPDVLTKLEEVILINEPIQFDQLCTIIKFKQLTSYKHEDDASLWKKLTSIEYFKNIPIKHLAILGSALVILVVLMIIFRPETTVQPMERKLLQATDSIVLHDAHLIEEKVDSLLIETQDTLTTSQDTVPVSQDSIVLPEPVIEEEELQLSYTVEKQDNLYRLSKTFNISLEKIDEINSLSGNTIYPGQKILLPYWKVHVVEKSQSLYEIKRKYNVSVQQIMKINKLEDVTIHDGMQLIIPYPNAN